MKVKIKVIGESKSGKSAIAILIKDALAAAGIGCEINDSKHETPEVVVRETMQARLKNILAQGIGVELKTTRVRDIK